MLPSTFPPAEPYIYLSTHQHHICTSNSTLAPYAIHLPCWIQHRIIGRAFGFASEGIDRALSYLRTHDTCDASHQHTHDACDRSYVWATEFENVHTYWIFEEPSFTCDGVQYVDSEDYYHKQKQHYLRDDGQLDVARWNVERVNVMRRAIRLKFMGESATSQELRDLLLSTGTHPLLSLKGDAYWGVTSYGEGENQLARLLMELRTQLQRDAEWKQNIE